MNQYFKPEIVLVKIEDDIITTSANEKDETSKDIFDDVVR